MSEIKSYVIEPDDQAPIRFKGTLLAEVENSPDAGSPHFSGAIGRWQEYELYKTEGGNYIGVIFNGTKFRNEREEIKVEVFDTIEKIRRFFHFTKLAKQLYGQLGIDFSSEIA